MKLQVLTRKLHRWGSIAVLLPFAVVIVSGVFLLLKKEVAWIQPPTMKGVSKIPSISFDAILSTAKTVVEAEVRSWDDIDRLDFRPEYGAVKVHCKNNWEIQMDTHTGEVLQVAYRRSDLIETIHDGSWFHERAKLWVFLPSTLIVFGLYVTGVYLFYLPYKARWQKRHRPSPPPARVTEKAVGGRVGD